VKVMLRNPVTGEPEPLTGKEVDRPRGVQGAGIPANIVFDNNQGRPAPQELPLMRIQLDQIDDPASDVRVLTASGPNVGDGALTIDGAKTHTIQFGYSERDVVRSKIILLT